MEHLDLNIEKIKVQLLQIIDHPTWAKSHYSVVCKRTQGDGFSDGKWRCLF